MRWLSCSLCSFCSIEAAWFEDARAGLMDKYSLSEKQASAMPPSVLMMDDVEKHGMCLATPPRMDLDIDELSVGRLIVKELLIEGENRSA